MAIVMLLVALGLSFATRANGQITSYLDERGKRVYVNADGPASTQHRPLKQARGAAAGSSRAMPAPRPRRTAQASRTQLEMIVHDAAQRHGVDPGLVRAVVAAESGWDPSAVSFKGAQGLMQLIPATTSRFGVADAFDPAENTEGGVRYLAQLLERYRGDLRKSLAAYYAGEGAVDRAGGVPRSADIQSYVERITASYEGRGGSAWHTRAPEPLPIYRTIDHQGRIIFTNQ